MQILVAIPHYYAESGTASPDGRWHGSVGQAAQARVEALSACIRALHQLYGPAQNLIDQATRVARPSNDQLAGHDGHPRGLRP